MQFKARLFLRLHFSAVPHHTTHHITQFYSSSSKQAQTEPTPMLLRDFFFTFMLIFTSVVACVSASQAVRTSDKDIQATLSIRSLFALYSLSIRYPFASVHTISACSMPKFSILKSAELICSLRHQNSLLTRCQNWKLWHRDNWYKRR
jgi:hypothetical protein